MRAVVLEKFGGPEVLEVKDAPDPLPGESQVLVRVRAAGLNRADLLQRQGKYPAPAGAVQNIPGLEFAGEVLALGPNAKRWKKGQRVFGLAAGGAQAELLVTHERLLAEIPASLNWAQAAAVPEVFITAQDALRQAALVRGEALLIHAIGSGVGLAAAQLGRLAGAKVYGTSRTAEKLNRAREFGMDDGIALHNNLSQLAPQIKKWTSGRGADVVLDLVGGDYLPASIEAMAVKGRLVSIGTVAGNRAEISLGQIMSKRLQIIGTALRSRSIEEKIAVTEAFAAEVVPALGDGRLRPVIDSEFPMREVRAAHRKLESGDTFGKVVLVLD